MVNKAIYILTGILLLMAASGTYYMLDGHSRSQYGGISSLFITLQFIIAVLIFLKNSGIKNLLYITGIFVFAMIVEIIGAGTGIPFGNYYYSGILQPQFFGVPVAVGMSWVMTSLASFYIIRTLSPVNSVFNVISSALIMTAYDFILEPFAAHVNGFWIWENGNVPLANYIAWFLVSLIIAFVLNQIQPKNNFAMKPGSLTSFVSAVLILTNILQFSFVNISEGYSLPVLAGITVISAVIVINKIRNAGYVLEKNYINV